MFCNWRFINLNTSFNNVTGKTRRSLFVYSDVGGSGVVGNQVTDLLRKVNYKRECQGYQYFEPLQIQYIQVRKEVLDIIEVQVAETTGELVNFNFTISSRQKSPIRGRIRLETHQVKRTHLSQRCLERNGHGRLERLKFGCRWWKTQLER